MKTLSKVLLSLFFALLLLVLVFAGVAFWDWQNTDESSVPPVSITVNGTALPPSGYDWNVPAVGGLFPKAFQKEVEEVSDFGLLEAPELPLSLPGGFQSEITVKAGEEILFHGSGEEYRDFVYPGDGVYRADITLTREKLEGTGYGSYSYAFSFTIQEPPKDPEIAVSPLSIPQGGVVGIEVTNIPEGLIPTLETELGAGIFLPDGEGRMIAYVGAAYNRDAGDYPLVVQCGELRGEYTIHLSEGEFERQDLTIDTSDPVISEANSPAAYAQYREAIYPLYETHDSQKYWSGAFTLPVEGYRISTPYGIKRYTNGASTPSRHAGTDFAVAQGTPVKAPAAGKVVFSQYLLNTGNTIAIEHGGGLKTIYFHMKERNVEQGDFVEQGQLIGQVGTTGYSTGPHLHFEVRLANQSVNPWNFFEGKAPFLE